MRALLVASPLVGHVLPLVPLAKALQEGGHQVVVATAGDGVAAARSCGVDVRDVVPGLRLGAVFARPALQHPLLLRRELHGQAGTDLVGRLFAAVSARMAGGVLALAEAFDADLVVHEPLAAAGSLAAARRKIPVVLLDASLFDAETLLAATMAGLRPTARRHGVSSLPQPADVLVTSPPSLVGPRRGTPMRFVPVAGEGAAPEDLTRPGERPRILVSRSTVADPRRDRLMSSVIAVAARADLEVVLVRPDRRATGHVLPPNVRTTGWLPFPAVFPAAAGVVHHGGAGTLMTALAAGIPQLVTPGSGDRTVNAELVAARGAGLAVPAEQITAAHLERLATDPALARAAREVAAEIAAMPGPADLVEPLAALAKRAPAEGGRSARTRTPRTTRP